MNQQVALYEKAVEALNRRQWQTAWAMACKLLGSVPDHGGVNFVAGISALEIGHMQAALVHLRRATQLSPHRADYAAQLARLLVSLRAFAEAHQYADMATALQSGDAVTADTLGVVYSRLNEHAKALVSFEAATARQPRNAAFQYNHATSLLFFGRLEEAEEKYQRCLDLSPDYWRAYTSLSQLRKWTPENNNIAFLTSRIEAAERSLEGQLYVNLALAKEQEDVGDHVAAFGSYVRAKAPQKRARKYESKRDEKIFKAIRQAFDTIDDFSGGSEHDDPIFIVGMPRSGTTLVDRIISSHPSVHSAGELENFPMMVKRLSATRTNSVADAETLSAVAGMDWAALGRSYVESTRPGTSGSPRFVDKLPHNFLYVGHIAKALPKAKIICLRRDPMDTCLSNFRQLFALSSAMYDYSFDLLDTGRYYLMFDELMAYWKSRLGDRVLEVRYEDIVDQQERESRRIIDFCDLTWNEACLRFEENAAPVATASAVQVRSKLSRDYLGRWRRYGQDVEPLRALLGSKVTYP